MAVKYINDHGRRQSDHGEPSPLPFRLNPGSVAAPDALKVTPRERARSSACLQIGRFFLRQALEQGLIRPCLANGRFSEKHEPLQIDLLDTDLGCNFHKCRELPRPSLSGQ